MKHDEPETHVQSVNGWNTSVARHGRKATRPGGKTRNAIFRRTPAENPYKETIE
ncbi:MAG: hypothetical protein ACLURK_03740 [Bifidobacterium sp.]